MQAWYLWWIIAAVLVGVELTTGTFYLLVYGVAAAVAGLAAWLGASLVVQLLVAALIASAGTYALRRWRRDHNRDADSALQGMDIGQSVQLETWSNGRGQVKYRGALWEAEAESTQMDVTQPLYIRAIRGSTLILGN